MRAVRLGEWEQWDIMYSIKPGRLFTSDQTPLWVELTSLEISRYPLPLPNVPSASKSSCTLLSTFLPIHFTPESQSHSSYLQSDPKRHQMKSLMWVWWQEYLHKFKAYVVHILGSRSARATWYPRERNEEEREETDEGKKGWAVDLGEIKNLRLPEVWRASLLGISWKFIIIIVYVSVCHTMCVSVGTHMQ